MTTAKTPKTAAKKTAAPKVSQAKAPSVAIVAMPLRQIHTLPQVRTEFDDASIRELADSIKSHGLLQPILIRAAEGTFVIDHDGKGNEAGKSQLYHVIAGERRYRAFSLLAEEDSGAFSSIPALVVQAEDDKAMELQLIENIQREELSLKDTAAGVLALYEKHKALAPVAQLVGKSLPWVSKHLSVATKLSFQATHLLENGHTEDLELLLTVSQIAGLPNSYPRLHGLMDKIEARKAGRKEARALLEQLRTEIEEQKAAKKAAKKAQQGELTLNEEKAAAAKKQWYPGDAVNELHDQLMNPDHAAIESLLAGYDDKQLKAMATIPSHVEGFQKGEKAQSDPLRALAGWLVRTYDNDPFDMAAFILGARQIPLTMKDLCVEVHLIMHGQAEQPKA